MKFYNFVSTLAVVCLAANVNAVSVQSQDLNEAPHWMISSYWNEEKEDLLRMFKKKDSENKSVLDDYTTKKKYPLSLPFDIKNMQGKDYCKDNITNLSERLDYFRKPGKDQGFYHFTPSEVKSFWTGTTQENIKNRINCHYRSGTLDYWRCKSKTEIQIMFKGYDAQWLCVKQASTMAKFLTGKLQSMQKDAKDK